MWSPECTVGCNNSDWLVGHSRKGLTEQRVVGLHGGHHLLRHLLVVTLCLASSYVWGAWSRHTHIQFIIHCIHYTVSLMNAFIKAYHRHTMKYFSCKWTCSIVWSFFFFFLRHQEEVVKALYQYQITLLHSWVNWVTLKLDPCWYSPGQSLYQSVSNLPSPTIHNMIYMLSCPILP